jgi:hypothetical protein
MNTLTKAFGVAATHFATVSTLAYAFNGHLLDKAALIGAESVAGAVVLGALFDLATFSSYYPGNEIGVNWDLERHSPKCKLMEKEQAKSFKAGYAMGAVAAPILLNLLMR